MNSRKFRPGGKLITAFAVLVFGWLLWLTASIVSYAGQSDANPADAAVVLGAAVANNLPTPVFEERIRHAVTLYHAGQVRALVLTGGVGAGDTLAESEVARAYCITQGVAPQDIAIETRSRTTFGNIVQARQIIAGRGWSRVLIVSDPLHMRRAITQARDVGLNAFPSPTPTSRYTGLTSQGKFAARELYFYAGYLLRRTFYGPGD